MSTISIYPQFEQKTDKQSGSFIDLMVDDFGLKLIPFSCARSATVVGLKSLGLTRLEEMLIPSYLGQCVLSALSKCTFPSLTLSDRTKAIMVFHQFGFPQNIDEIKTLANDKKLFILNNCAHSLYPTKENHLTSDLVDFSVVSFSKFFPCALGWGAATQNADLSSKMSELSSQASDWSSTALRTMRDYYSGNIKKENISFEINALYGYLPDAYAFPEEILHSLPTSSEAIQNDIKHRKGIWELAKNAIGDSLPSASSDFIPFAVPLLAEETKLINISNWIMEKFSIEAPVLHFDTHCNMLNPNYKKALIIGCHSQWDTDIVDEIFKEFKK